MSSQLMITALSYGDCCEENAREVTSELLSGRIGSGHENVELDVPVAVRVGLDPIAQNPSIP
jgi:hypothetical protein